jgi:3-mercaptopyruvate sulfurtransferase SseA
MLIGAAGLLLTAMLTIWGCGGGGSSYDDPSTSSAVTTTKTATALIQPEELKAWMDEGKVNQVGGYDRVVIIEVNGTTTNYDVGHIPGAQSASLGTDLSQVRVEGPMLTGALAPDGTTMDALIQRLGIDANTTIVFTTSEAEAGSPWNLTRGYTVFRYWGFPKERLKVLDGGNKLWKAKGYEITTVKPTIARSTYCVTPNNVSRIRTDLRAALPEMMAAVTAGTALNDFIDGRSTDAPAINPTGGTTDLIDTSKYVVFEGGLKGSRYKAHTLLHTSGDFKTIDEVKTALAIPANAATVYTLCRAGNIASVLFFAIDGYAYYNEVAAGALKAVWYDGSWGQWGLLSDSTANGGKLPAGSVWKTDVAAFTDTLTFNVGRNIVPVSPATTPPTYLSATSANIINFSSRLTSPEPPLAAGNQLEEADAAYRSPVTVTTGGTASGSGGGC